MFNITDYYDIKTTSVFRTRALLPLEYKTLHQKMNTPTPADA